MSCVGPREDAHALEWHRGDRADWGDADDNGCRTVAARASAAHSRGEFARGVHNVFIEVDES